MRDDPIEWADLDWLSVYACGHIGGLCPNLTSLDVSGVTGFDDYALLQFLYNEKDSIADNDTAKNSGTKIEPAEAPAIMTEPIISLSNEKDRDPTDGPGH